MNRPPDQETHLVPYSPGHLTDESLELFAEGALPDRERVDALAHLERCPRCAAELESARSLIAALEGLSRFAPSPDFSEAVMARVSIPEPAFARVRRWLPATRKGWMMLVAALLLPLAPLLAGIGWLLSQPLVSVGGLATMGQRWIFSGADALASWLLDFVIESGLWTRASDLLSRVPGLVSEQVTVAGAVIAVAIPLSILMLVRLLRTPSRGWTHAR